jgi:membrane associated rhomboid family serine protease
MALAVVLWAAGDFIGLFAPGEVAHIAHLGGLAAGLGFGLLFYKRFHEKNIKRKIGKIPEKRIRKWEEDWL